LTDEVYRFCAMVQCAALIGLSMGFESQIARIVGKYYKDTRKSGEVLNASKGS
jgi:hypothetical protein